MKTNSAVINAAHQEMAAWRNDRGHNAAGPAFYPENWARNDMGSQVYHDAGRSGVEISLPHILNIAIEVLTGLQQVNLFGAVRNFTAANFGNNVNITVTYLSNNPLVPFLYSDLLGATISEPMQIGIIRIQTVTTQQANQTISLLRNPGVGKFEGLSMFPLIYPNQYINNISYLENAFKLDKYMYLSYLQNATTDANIQLYFYQNANVNLDRAFSNQAVVSQYAKPQTGISSQMTINSPVAMSPAAVRSGSLL